jgi:hypothetical protein
MVAGVGQDAQAVVAGAKAFPVTKLVLVFEERDAKAAVDVASKLSASKFEVERRLIKGPLPTELLAAMAQLLQSEGLHFDDVIINISGGEKLLSCSLLSAAFVNGLRAIAIVDGKVMQLPVLKFSYSEMISESKMNILRALARAGGAVDSLNTLSEMSGVEKSLLSYHIRGGRDAKGLEELNLVAIERAKQGRLMVSLTEMGRLMLLSAESEQHAPAAQATPTTA